MGTSLGTFLILTVVGLKFELGLRCSPWEQWLYFIKKNNLEIKIFLGEVLPNRISIFAKVFSSNKNIKNPNSPDFEGNTIWFQPA
jgi:hypothetical protein